MAGYQPADSSIAALLKIRIADGAVVARYDLPYGDGHVLGDLAIGPADDVFVTDSRSPIVYRLAPGAESLTTFEHPLFRSLQGVAPTPDGTAVYLADYSHGLLRWNLATGVVTRLAAPAGTTSLGVDGIVLDGARIFAIQNGAAPARLVRFDLDPSGERIAAVSIVDRHLPLADEPTIATRLGPELLYVANSQWEKYDDRGRRLPGTTVAPTVVLSLRIR
jgi:sugar lactone lactonase YvrE